MAPVKLNARLSKIARVQHVQPDGVYQQLQRWLQDNPGGPHLRDPYVRDKVIQILGGQIPGSNVAVRTSTGGARPAAWHPSSLGRCMRAQVFEYMGVPYKTQIPDTQLLLIFHDGLFRHLKWQIMGMNAGIFHDFEVPGYNAELRIAYNLDAIYDNVGVEVKGTQKLHHVQKNGKPLPEHEPQIQAYLMAKPELDHMVAIYEDKRAQDIFSVGVQRDPEMQEELRETVDTLNDHVDYKVLPPILKECIHGKGKEFRECSYSHICLGIKDWKEADRQACSTSTAGTSGGAVGSGSTVSGGGGAATRVKVRTRRVSASPARP